MDLIREFGALIDALHRENVEYAVCGGIAVTIHGYVRTSIHSEPSFRSTIIGSSALRRFFGTLAVPRKVQVRPSSLDTLTRMLLSAGQTAVGRIHSPARVTIGLLIGTPLAITRGSLHTGRSQSGFSVVMAMASDPSPTSHPEYRSLPVASATGDGTGPSFVVCHQKCHSFPVGSSHRQWSVICQGPSASSIT